VCEKGSDALRGQWRYSLAWSGALLMVRLKLGINQSQRGLLLNVAILTLLSICLIALSLHLWKLQESKNLTQIWATAESKARSYARETETRYNKMSQALTRLASRGSPRDETGMANWEEDAAFYIQAFEGFRSIAWVDAAFLIRQIVPIQGNETHLGKSASRIERLPADVHQWLPIVHDGKLEGFVFAMIDIASFLSPVLREIDGHYMLQLSDEGLLVFESENWESPSEETLLYETITLQDTTVLKMAFAPAAALLQSGAADARRTLAVALFLSSIVITAVYFARSYRAMARLNQHRYRNLFEASQDAIFITDLEGKYQDANPAATRMVGYSLAELQGMAASDLRLSRDETSPDVLLRMRTGGGMQELSLRGKEGQAIPVELMMSPIVEGGTQKRVLGIARDVSERVRAEETRLAMESSLRQSQKLESLGTLASGAAHEINNPLMGMINYAVLIADKVEEGSPVKAYSQVIIKEGDRIAKIVRNLLSFSRQDKETHSPAALKDIIDNSLSLVGSTLRKDQITVEQSVPEDLPQVKCRSQQIEQVIINLLTNAHYALNVRYPEYDEDKIIRITARTFEKDGEDWIRTTIEDHGAEIPEDVAPRIFDPFFTTKPRDEGTGLGLSVSYGIIKEHHGELTVESKPGEYTRFHMDLRINNG